MSTELYKSQNYCWMSSMIYCLTLYKLNLTSPLRTLLAEAEISHSNKTNPNRCPWERNWRKKVDYVSQPRSNISSKQQTRKLRVAEMEDLWKSPTSQNDRPCFWSESQNHDGRYCPAWDTICSNCDKKGHFQPSVRLIRYVVEVEEKEWIHLL